jgi:hypothetical protein
MFTVELIDETGSAGDCIYLFFDSVSDAKAAGFAALEEHAIDRRNGRVNQYQGWAHGFRIIDDNEAAIFEHKKA